MRGELTGLSLNYQTKQPEITLTVDGDIEQLERLKGQPLTVELKRFRRKRSLESNSYHWTLCTKISEALGQSVAWVHNMALRKCGYMETIGGKIAYIEIPDTVEAEREALEAETFHIVPTSSVRAAKDGQMYRTYAMLRGSHTYDTKEMSHLIDLVVGWAKELGIDTITETEKREMMERYGSKHPEHGTA